MKVGNGDGQTIDYTGVPRALFSAFRYTGHSPIFMSEETQHWLARAARPLTEQVTPSLSERAADGQKTPHTPGQAGDHHPLKNHGSRLRKFRFDRPQQYAALLLFGLLLQCLFVIQHAPLTESDYQYARCGREMWEKPSPLAGYFTSCGNIHDGTLAYRAAGLPLTIQRIVLGQGADTSTWEMRNELSAVRLLLRLPFTLVALLLGGALWWVTRRLFGNAGGYIALGLYCFSPLVVNAATTPGSEILTALGLFAAVYTGMGVAHAMHGPRRKWRPRIILLTLAFGLVAASHVVAVLPMLVLVAIFMGYLAAGHRSPLPMILLLCSAGMLFLVFASYAFHPDAFTYYFRSGAGRFTFSLEPAKAFFRELPNAGITIACGTALVLCLVTRRSRYFGNTAPLLCAVLLLPFVPTGVFGEPRLWALPFLLTFAGGVFADVLETRYRRRYLWLVAAIVLLQAGLCLVTLPGLLG